MSNTRSRTFFLGSAACILLLALFGIAWHITHPRADLTYSVAITPNDPGVYIRTDYVTNAGITLVFVAFNGEEIPLCDGPKWEFAGTGGSTIYVPWPNQANNENIAVPEGPLEQRLSPGDSIIVLECQLSDGTTRKAIIEAR